MPAAERPIINAVHVEGLCRPLGAAAHGPQHRVPARRHHEQAAEALSRPATEREAELMDDGVQPSRAPDVGGGEVRFEPLGEDLRWALWSDAPEPADADRDDDAPAGDRQIRQGASVAAVHPRRDALASRTPG